MPRLARPTALVIESDADYRLVIAACVESAGAQVEAVEAVSQGLRRVQAANFELVIWGVPLQDPRRAHIVAQLHEEVKVPLILLDESYDEARESFEAGADQVLPKPFVPGALVGAVRAALRGPGPESLIPLASRIEVGPVVFDSDSRTITHGQDSISLAKREWELLSFLLARPNQWLAAGELVKQAWAGSQNSVDQLRTYVARMRRKLEPLQLPFEIASKQGRGYCLVYEDAVTG
ncbi:MAG: response regulator transcription factor [Candidatus Dormibacteraeota bacterium]|nr:response regulator transcription factor [Candidatus Dormibacteraeota bacterium]